MNQNPIRICIGLLWPLVAVASAAGQGGHPQRYPVDFCEFKDVQVVEQSGKSPLKVEQVGFASSSQQSHTRIVATNVSEERIARAALVLDFVDKHGTRLVTIPAYYSDDELLASKRLQNRAFDTEWMPQALAARHVSSAAYLVDPDRTFGPHSRRRIPASTETIATTCPSAVRVTAVTVQYASGTVSTWLGTAWHLPPMVQNSYTLDDVLKVNLSDFPVHVPHDFAARIVVSEGGCPTVAESPDMPTAVRGWLHGVISRWRFLPAVSGDSTAKDNIWVLFRFYKGSTRNDDWALRKKQLPASLVVAEVIPADADGHGVILYGGSPLSIEPFKSSCGHP